jgi:hypothetical protein
MVKYTPGPYHVETDPEHDPTRHIMAGRMTIAAVYDLHGVTGHSDAEAEGNAHLLAAAPGMLALLHAVLAALRPGGTSRVGDVEAVARRVGKLAPAITDIIRQAQGQDA